MNVFAGLYMEEENTVKIKGESPVLRLKSLKSVFK